MRPTIITIIAAVLLSAVLSCGDDPMPVFEKMKTEGCEADVQGFFSHIDKTAVRDNFTKDTLDKIKDGAYEDMLSERAQELTGHAWDSMASEYTEAVWKEYTGEVLKGKTGKICRMQIVTVNKNTVTVKMPGEPDIVWVFGKPGDALKVVSVY